MFSLQADPEVEVETAQQPKKRTFKKFTFRGVDLDALLDMSSDELVELFHARARRRFAHHFLLLPELKTLRIERRTYGGKHNQLDSDVNFDSFFVEASYLCFKLRLKGWSYEL